jgi:D-psicose/D-tagatose/L-ribulose 3-epimerase
MKRAGMDFVELLVPEAEEMDAAAAGKAARDAGLFVALAARVNLQRDLASPDAACSAAGIAYLKQCVDVAVAMQATIVGGPLYGAPLVFAGRPPAPIAEADRAACVARVAAGLRDAGAYAAEHGITLAVEPLNRFETDFCNTARQAVALVKMVDSPAVGIMFDTFHANMEEDDMPQAIRHSASHLVHFQANENHRGFLGMTRMPILRIPRRCCAAVCIRRNDDAHRLDRLRHACRGDAAAATGTPAGAAGGGGGRERGTAGGGGRSLRCDRAIFGWHGVDCLAGAGCDRHGGGAEAAF